ncbi:MAG: hypothetical protein HY543_03390 [Deltaproteobacteria bacterium]|nr:hypothetical protein [Deltaproteobacteria bacterium]
MNQAACSCTWDWKKWAIGTIVVAAVYAGIDYVVHHKVLLNLYQANAHLWRAPAETSAKMWWLWLNYVAFGALFAWIYTKGYVASKAGPSQGLRYGFLLGVFYWGMHLMGSYPFLPWPDALYKNWFAFGIAEFAVLGWLVGLVYQPKS